MITFPYRLMRAAAIVVAVTMLGTTMVVADDMAPDGDGPTVANFSGLNFGNVCAGQTYTRDVPIYIQRAWPAATPTDQQRTFNGGSPGVTISFAAAATAPVSASLIDTNVVLPTDWRTDTVTWFNGKIYTGDSASVRVTLTPTTSGSQTINMTATGLGGNAGTTTVSRTIQDLKVDWTVTTVGCDSTAPVITPTTTGTLGNNGWYTSNVTVTFSVVDNESTVSSKSAACDATNQVTADTNGVTFTCSAASAGGTASESVTIKRDATDPTLSPTVSPNPVLLNGSATATANASDATTPGSGLASSSCDPVDTTAVGSKSVTCYAEDNAGNTNTANASYSVAYAFSGFFAPVDNPTLLNKAKAGQAIPLKWRLTDANGDPVTNLASVTLTVASLSCWLSTTSDAVEEYGTGNSGLQNLGDGYYQFNWATPKGYANSCKTAKLNVGDGTTHTALFQFTK
jgi:hypothetical protein